MTTSSIIAIALLIVAIVDTLLARFLLAPLFAKNSQMPEAQKRLILRMINGGTFVFAGAAIVIYLTQYFG